MELIKCRDVRWKGPEKRNKPDVAATTAKRPDSRSQISRYGWIILVPRGRAPFGQHQESRPLAKSNTGSPRFTDFPSLCACSESSLTNLIGSGLNLLCLLSHSKTECRWSRPEVAILGADQKERGFWGRECGWMQPTYMRSVSFLGKFTSGSRISASRSDLLKLPIVYHSSAHY